MIADGYSNAEIGILNDKAIEIANKNYEYIKKITKDAAKAEETSHSSYANKLRRTGSFRAIRGRIAKCKALRLEKV